MIGFDGEIEEQTCSRAGCTGPAVWNINWRNPRIHPLTRVKIWLACDGHRDFLHDYLEARDFPVVVTPLAHPLEHLPQTVASKNPS